MGTTRTFRINIYICCVAKSDTAKKTPIEFMNREKLYGKRLKCVDTEVRQRTHTIAIPVFGVHAL